MANSYTEVTLSSPQTVGFTTPSYLDSSHLTVRVNGVVVPKTTGTGKTFGSFTSTNNLFYTIVEGQTTISFSEQIPSGAVVKISRSTSPDTKLVNYVDNTLITAKLLNEDSNQSFFLSQEALEGTTIGDITGNVTGNVSGSAATVTNAAQPSITSVGELTGLTMGATSSTVGGKILFKEATNNGTNSLTLQSPASTADVTVTLPNTTGTVALTDATNTAEFFEISSATAPTADNAAHPVLSLYDSSDRSSLANTVTNGQEHTGAIRWYFNNDAGNKSFLGAIRGIVRDSEDGAERGSIEFTLPTGSAGDTVTDVTAAHSNVESPIMTLHKYGLVMASGNDLFFSAAADVLEWDTGSHKQSIRGRSSESSGGNSVLELPDASGTMAHIATNGGLQHPTLSSAPSSPANGQTYYNTTDHKLKLYANGGWVDLN